MSNQKNEPFGTPDADGWYEWKGDDMIRPAGMVEVILRDKTKNQPWPAEKYSWKHWPQGSDIVKWRPAQ